MVNNNLFEDNEENLYEQINKFNNKDEVLLSENISNIIIIPLGPTCISKNKNQKNLINKKRKDLFKCNKETDINKSKSKVEKQIFEDNNRINGDNNHTTICDSFKYDKFDDITELKSYDFHYDKHGILTFTSENEENENNSLSQQLFNDHYSNLSEEISIANNPEINTFNYDSYKKGKRNKYNIYNINVEPKFSSFNHILNIYEKDIGKIWSKEVKIFENKKELNNTLKNGKIYQNVFNLLSKNISYKAEKRKFDADGMINKIKTKLLDSILNYINSFDEMKKYKIYTLKKNLINTKIGAHFNLVYLKQYLYDILSNDSSESNYNTNKDKILKIKDEYSTFFNQKLCLTVQNCLDIFRYKQPNPYFKNKLFEFLNKEYKEFKDDIIYRKDYIAALILLVYNFERFFYLRLPDSYKNEAK